MIEEKRACEENENVELIEDRGFGIIDASAEVLKVRNKMVGRAMSVFVMHSERLRGSLFGDKRLWLSIWRLEVQAGHPNSLELIFLIHFVDLIESQRKKLLIIFEFFVQLVLRTFWIIFQNHFDVK